MKFQVPAKGGESLLTSTKTALQKTVLVHGYSLCFFPLERKKVHGHSSHLTLLYQEAILLQELLSSIPLNFYFPTISWLSDFIYFFQCEQLFSE